MTPHRPNRRLRRQSVARTACALSVVLVGLAIGGPAWAQMGQRQLELAREALEAGDWEQADLQARSAQRLDPAWMAEGWKIRGLAARGAGSLDLAESYLTVYLDMIEGIEEDPEVEQLVQALRSGAAPPAPEAPPPQAAEDSAAAPEPEESEPTAEEEAEAETPALAEGAEPEEMPPPDSTPAEDPPTRLDAAAASEREEGEQPSDGARAETTAAEPASTEPAPPPAEEVAVAGRAVELDGGSRLVSYEQVTAGEAPKLVAELDGFQPKANSRIRYGLACRGEGGAEHRVFAADPGVGLVVSGGSQALLLGVGTRVPIDLSDILECERDSELVQFELQLHANRVSLKVAGVMVGAVSLPSSMLEEGLKQWRVEVPASIRGELRDFSLAIYDAKSQGRRVFRAQRPRSELEAVGVTSAPAAVEHDSKAFERASRSSSRPVVGQGEASERAAAAPVESAEPDPPSADGSPRPEPEPERLAAAAEEDPEPDRSASEAPEEERDSEPEGSQTAGARPEVVAARAVELLDRLGVRVELELAVPIEDEMVAHVYVNPPGAGWKKVELEAVGERVFAVELDFEDRGWRRGRAYWWAQARGPRGKDAVGSPKRPRMVTVGR